MNPALRAEIRPMTVADVERVMEIAASLPSAPQWPRRAYMDALEPQSKPPRIALVAVQLQAEPLPPDPLAPKPMPAAMLGFIVASLIAPQAELEIIAVVAQSQRQGLGNRLMRALAEQMIQAGIAEILLEVRASYLPAIALYSRFGFRQSGLRAGYYADPIEDAVLMTKQLKAPLEP
jgi:ribosomal-protein-alanine N-acetyltransferase